jgi:hypothetical protein
VFGEDPPNQILVDIHPECPGFTVSIKTVVLAAF